MRPKKREKRGQRPSGEKRRSASGMRQKWTPIDQRAAEHLTQTTSSPGIVFPVGTSVLPSNLQQMPGAVSYFVSGYTVPVPAAPNVTAGGEMVVVRTEGDLAKA